MTNLYYRPYKPKNYCIRLNEEQIKELDEVRKEMGHSRSQAIGMAIDTYIRGVNRILEEKKYNKELEEKQWQ